MADKADRKHQMQVTKQLGHETFPQFAPFDPFTRLSPEVG
jgi:hypothetical protein